MVSKTGDLSHIHAPLYNSRLIKNYVEYIKKFHPDLDLQDILHYSWIRTYELEDQGHWFSQYLEKSGNLPRPPKPRER